MSFTSTFVLFSVQFHFVSKSAWILLEPGSLFLVRTPTPDWLCLWGRGFLLVLGILLPRLSAGSRRRVLAVSVRKFPRYILQLLQLYRSPSPICTYDTSLERVEKQLYPGQRSLKVKYTGSKVNACFDIPISHLLYRIKSYSCVFGCLVIHYLLLKFRADLDKSTRVEEHLLLSLICLNRVDEAFAKVKKESHFNELTRSRVG